MCIPVIQAFVFSFTVGRMHELFDAFLIKLKYVFEKPTFA